MSGAWLLTCVWADRWHCFCSSAQRHRGAGKPSLFFAVLSVVGDTEQLTDRKVSRLKLGLACEEQKDFTTHELTEKGNRQHGELDVGGKLI